MEINVDPSKVIEKKADDRGRVTLGAGYADQMVTVAIVDSEDRAGKFVCANCGTAEELDNLVYAGGCDMCGAGPLEAGVPERALDGYELDSLLDESEDITE